MAFNGSGTFNRIYSWVTDAANGLFVSSTRTDTDSNDIAAGLTNCICKDGQSTPTANLPMGGFKLTNLGVGSATTDSANLSQLIGYAGLELCEFRLSLTTATPVTTSDVTAATTVFMTPYRGNRIALYDGSNWHVYTTAELSIAFGGGGIASASTMYDIFCVQTAGVLSITGLAWTNDTTRATALALQDGILVRTDNHQQRYIGSIYVNASSQFTDSMANRHVWNYYNRVSRPMKVGISSINYTYTTATLRQAAGSATNQLNFVVGWSEDRVRAQVTGTVSNTNVGVAVNVTIGLDSTTARATDAWYADGGVTLVTNQTQSMNGGYAGFPGVGRHILTWLESSQAVGTSTWNLSTLYNISGEIMG